MEKRKCLTCNNALFGRNGKKFCHSQCRSHYHNEQNTAMRKLYYRTNRILKRNHQILEKYIEKGKRKIKKQELMELGFRFDYHTHVMVLEETAAYYFCYNQGWQESEEDWLILIPGS